MVLGDNKITIRSRQLKWIYILIAGSIFFYVLIIFSKMIYGYLPDSDLSAAIAKIWFMSNTGVGKTIYWYSGYYPFLQYPPLASFIGAIIYSFVNNLGAAMYLEILMILLLCFLGFVFLKRIKQLTWVDTIIYFLIFVINPVTTSWWLYKYGRTTELLGWAFLIFIFCFVYRYKDKEFDKWILLLIIPLTLSVLAHPSIFFLSVFPLFGLTLSKIKKPKQLVMLIFIVSLALILSSFWWFSMIQARASGKYVSLTGVNGEGGMGGGWLEMLVYPLFFSILTLLLLIFKRDKYMIWPILLVLFIYPTGLIRIIPFYNSFSMRLYAILLILFMIFESKKEWLNINLLVVAITLFSLTSLVFFNSVIFAIDDPFYNSSMTLLKRNPPDNFIAIDEISNDTRHNPKFVTAIYSYAPIYFNYTTPYGWFIQEETPNLHKLREDLKSDNCSLIQLALIELKVGTVISDKCDFLSYECRLKLKDRENQVCLYKINISEKEPGKLIL